LQRLHFIPTAIGTLSNYVYHARHRKSGVFGNDDILTRERDSRSVGGPEASDFFAIEIRVRFIRLCNRAEKQEKDNKGQLNDAFHFDYAVMLYDKQELPIRISTSGYSISGFPEYKRFRKLSAKILKT